MSLLKVAMQLAKANVTVSDDDTTPRSKRLYDTMNLVERASKKKNINKKNAAEQVRTHD